MKFFKRKPALRRVIILILSLSLVTSMVTFASTFTNDMSPQALEETGEDEYIDNTEEDLSDLDESDEDIDNPEEDLSDLEESGEDEDIDSPEEDLSDLDEFDEDEGIDNPEEDLTDLDESGEDEGIDNPEEDLNELDEDSDQVALVESLEMAVPSFYGYNITKEINQNSISGTLKMDAYHRIYSGNTTPGILSNSIERTLTSSTAYTTEWLIDTRKINFDITSKHTINSSSTSILYSRVGADGKIGTYDRDVLLPGTSISNKSISINLATIEKMQKENPGIYIVKFDVWTNSSWSESSKRTQFNVVLDPETIIPKIDFINGTGANSSTDPEYIRIGFTNFSLAPLKDYKQEWIIKKSDGTELKRYSITFDQGSDKNSIAEQKAKEEQLQKELTKFFKTLNKGDYTITLNGSATSTTKGLNYRIENTLTKPFTLTKDAPKPDPVGMKFIKYIEGKNAIDFSEIGEAYNNISNMNFYEFTGFDLDATSIFEHNIQTSDDKTESLLSVNTEFYPGYNHFVLEVGPSKEIAENVSYEFKPAELLNTQDLSVVQVAELIQDYSSEIPAEHLSNFQAIINQLNSESREYRLWKFEVPSNATSQDYTFRMNSQIYGTNLSAYIKTFTETSPQNLDALLLPDGNINFPVQDINLSSANIISTDFWSRAVDTVAYFSVGQRDFDGENDNGYRVSKVYIVDDINGLPDDPTIAPTNLLGTQPTQVGALALGGNNPGWSVNDYWSVTISKEHTGGVVVFYYEPKDKGSIKITVPEHIDFGTIRLGETAKRYPLSDVTYSIDDTRVQSSYWELTMQAEPFLKDSSGENLFRGSMYYIDKNGNEKDIVTDSVTITNRDLAFPQGNTTHYTHTWGAESQDAIIFSTPGELLSAQKYHTVISWSIQQTP